MYNIKKNYLLQVSYQILNMCLPFLTSPYISRILGADNLGIYSYTFSIANFFALFINLGIIKYGSRTIAEVKYDGQRINQVFTELLIMKVILGAIVILLYYGCVFFFFPYKIFFAIQGLVLFASVFDINWFFFGIEKFKITVTRNFIIKLITVTCIFLFVQSRGDLLRYVLIMTIGTTISESIIWVALFKYVKIVKIKIMNVKKHIKPMLILFIAVLAQSAYTYIDKIMIGSLGSMEQLGYCDNAYKIIAFPMGLISSLGVVMLPRMTILYCDKNETEAMMMIRNSMRFVMLIACPLVAGLSAVGEIFSVVFWGIEFKTCGLIITIISPIIFFMSWSDVIRNQYLIPKKRDKDYSMAIVIGAIVNILSNMILIRQFGAIGAAIGTVCSYFSIALYQIWITRKELPYSKFLHDSLGPFICSVIMFVVVYNVGETINTLSIQSLLVQIFVGILVYSLLIIIYFWINSKKKERKNEK